MEWNFGISEPHRVKAGIMDSNGSLVFINGSGADDEGAEFTGGGFARIMHKGMSQILKFIAQMVVQKSTNWEIMSQTRALLMMWS